MFSLKYLRTYILELRKLLGDTPLAHNLSRPFQSGDTAFSCLLPRKVWEVGVQHLVGRETELDALHTQLGRARKGERATLFLTGETGIGKTALIDAFCNRICEEAAAWACVGSYSTRPIHRGLWREGSLLSSSRGSQQSVLRRRCKGPRAFDRCRARLVRAEGSGYAFALRNLRGSRSPQPGPKHC